MKQELWIVNSSLLVIFFVILALSEILKVEPPKSFRIKRIIPVELSQKEPSQVLARSWEKIYQNDIFGTFAFVEPKTVKQSFVTPIPEPRAPIIAPPPEPKKQEFIPPLNVTVKGIIVSSEESKNVSMIADEAGKESLYHLGDKLKDAQIIKIARNKVIVLRANGQQESFYLRKDDVVDTSSPDRWKYIIKKINDQSYEIDPDEFIKEVDTFGSLLERTSVVGMAYQDGKSLGVKLGAQDKNEVGEQLGFVENDIIVSVAGIMVADAKSRMQAYDKVVQMRVGDSIEVKISRSSGDVTINYKLVKIEKGKKLSFPGVKTEAPSTAQAQAAEQDLASKMSKLQEREQRVRNFESNHETEDRHQQAMAEIRRRLLDNLHSRLQNSRIR